MDHGQQVELCIDRADIVIDNGGEVTLSPFKKKVLNYAGLAAGDQRRFAEPHEILMHQAYASSHSSKCLKRHVGAVVVAPTGEIVGVGYNENPSGTNPCVEEPEYGRRCFRDIVRNNHFEKLSEDGGKCPACGNKLPVIQGPPWRCPSCEKKGIKTNLEAFFFPDRAMNWCTAIHAEDRALISAGGQAKGATLYTTTFPCFQCAEKLTHVGIRKVFFTEAYPDPESARRLKIAGVEFVQFEGVRSAAFERLFSTMRPS